MGADKVDRRTRYTQRALKESLMELMQEKPIGKITIKEICERADLNRCTFYVYYRDQYALLRCMEDEIIDELNEQLATYHLSSKADEAFRVVEKIFQYIAHNSDFCRLLLSERGDVEFQKRVMFIAQRQYVLEWGDEKEVDEETAEYLYLFVVNGSIGIVQNWLKNGMHKSSGEMAQLLLRLTSQGLSSFV